MSETSEYKKIYEALDKIENDRVRKMQAFKQYYKQFPDKKPEKKEKK
jgi:hypothetical protein